ncbi:MAG TPA: hypothetical protein VFI84_01375 [Candidatus Saccharimonadales bacterium]|nr:hypothetical protein [Candidatus Saccharimonadales bacterium]
MSNPEAVKPRVTSRAQATKYGAILLEHLRHATEKARIVQTMERDKGAVARVMAQKRLTQEEAEKYIARELALQKNKLAIRKRDTDASLLTQSRLLVVNHDEEVAYNGLLTAIDIRAATLSLQDHTGGLQIVTYAIDEEPSAHLNITNYYGTEAVVDIEVQSFHPHYYWYYQ